MSEPNSTRARAISGLMRPGIQWHRFAWAGAQLGGTLWIALVAVALAMNTPAWSAVPALVFVVANLVGWRLWRSRGRLSARNGLFLLMAVEFVAAAVTLFALDELGVLEAAQVEGGKPNVGRGLYLYLLVFPLVAAWIWWIDRMLAKNYAAFVAGRQRSGRDSGS